jgi:hypothetical protein
MRRVRHSSKGVLDFGKLGYSEERIKKPTAKNL